jgi:chemosensory pili system protein ChpC
MTGRPQRTAHTSEVRGLIAPTTQGNLLLPTAGVAEVVAYSGGLRGREGAPSWFLGELAWRGQRPPLIDLGTTAGNGASPVADARARWRRPCVLICFSLNGNPVLPYVGFLVADSPRLVRIRPGDLVLNGTSERHPLVLYAAQLQGRAAWIPDLDAVERQVQGLGRKG